ncbi:MAG: peptidyl-prolyl cis-trans isomerase [Candidatus Poribacteria bacterium]|nr:peptidyl-prolyl cis-trans isomerase [Candidatus Poribacteria bacterium]
MKKTITIFVIVVMTCLLTWRFVQSDGHEQSMPAVDESQVILAAYKWNDKSYEISLADLNAAIAELPVYRQQNYENREDKAEYLEELIEERLKILRATDEGFDMLPEHLKKLEDYTHQLMVEKLTEAEVDAKVVYTDEELMAYYQENLSEYIEEAKVRAICISLDDEDLAYETLDAIKAGKDIVEMAKELSEAGKLASGPGTNRDDPGNTYFFSKAASARWSEFIEAAFALEVGEMTEAVFETEVNDAVFYLIFRKEEHQPDRQQEFEEVKDDIVRTIEREKKRERINEWVEEISAKGKLKTYPENIPEPPQPEEEAETEVSDE